MKKYKLNIPALHKNVILELPLVSRKERMIKSFASIIEWAYKNSIPIFLLGLFIVKELFAFQGLSPELYLLNYVLIFLAFIAILYLTRIVLFGAKHLIEPAFFTATMGFACITVIANVSINPINPSNTFGSGDFRLLSGISVLAFTLLFLFTRDYLKTGYSLKNILRAMLLGFFGYLIINLLSNDYNLIANQIPSILIIGGFFTTLAFNSGRFRNFKIISMLALVILALLKVGFIAQIDILFGQILFALLITTLLIDLILFVLYKERLIKLLKVSRDQFREVFILKNRAVLNLLARNFALSVLIFSPLILTLLLVLIATNNPLFVDNLRISFQNIGGSFNYLTILSRINPTALFLGGGFSSYIESISLFANIIRMLGLLGILSYVGLGSYAIYNFISALRHNRYNEKILISLGFVLIVVPVISFVIYPGLFLVLIWWIAFAILSYIVSSKSNTLDLTDTIIKPLTIFGRFNNRIGVAIKLMLIALIVVAIGLLTYIIIGSTTIY